MNLKTLKTYCCAILLSGTFISCKKDWLGAKPDKSLAVPTTINDFQALLDNNNIFNANSCTGDEIGAGDFYVTDATWAAGNVFERNAYIWAPDIYEDLLSSSDWQYSYERIFYSNVVLEGIDKILPKSSIDTTAWNNVKGAALFHRAFNHYGIAQLFCKPYNKNTANSDLGIPLRLESDINVRSVRSTVQQTYDQIIQDLKHSLALLPISGPVNSVYRVRPTKAAVNAMLARTYLAMNNYDSAYVYANSCLQLYSQLLDYNGGPQVNVTGTQTFNRLNDEVLFHITGINPFFFGSSRLIVDSNLYKLYGVNDMRKDCFFRSVTVPGINNTVTFKGSYNINTIVFTGLATDEVYLIRAECNARKGNTQAALFDVNSLLQKRWRNTTSFQPLTATDANDALKKILLERRKELCFRALRWSDLRRFNQDPQLTNTLTRVINGRTYTLLPSSPLYVFPIPPIVIQLSGMQQNQR